MQNLWQEMNMKQNDFITLVLETKFDENIKQLLITSYNIGYDQGKVETLKEAINRIDWFEIERKFA